MQLVWLYKAIGLTLAGALTASTYWSLLRPWYLHWGSTDIDLDRCLSGDDLIPQPYTQSTRAVTIQASAKEIWPWIVQIGQDRGGFYSYDWLENLMGLDIHSADRIRPEFQHLQVGDLVRFAPDGGPGMLVATIEPEYVLVLRAMDPRTHQPIDRTAAVYWDFTWSFMLQPYNDHTTHVILRGRGDGYPHSVAALGLLLEPIQFVMERKMLLGLKQRVEQAGRTWLGNICRW